MYCKYIMICIIRDNKFTNNISRILSGIINSLIIFPEIIISSSDFSNGPKT